MHQKTPFKALFSFSLTGVFFVHPVVLSDYVTLSKFIFFLWRFHEIPIFAVDNFDTMSLYKGCGEKHGLTQVTGRAGFVKIKNRNNEIWRDSSLRILENIGIKSSVSRTDHPTYWISRKLNLFSYGVAIDFYPKT